MEVKSMVITQEQQTIEEIKELCNWAAGLQYEDLPEAVIRRAKWVLLDDIGAILAGSLSPEVTALKKSYLLDQLEGSSTILGKGFEKTNRFTAAELNGMAGCWEELDEGYRLATSHAGIYTVPALLSLAETMQSTMEEVITSLIVGYEFGARFGEGWIFEPLTIHPHGVFVTIASAAACARLKGLNAQELFDVITTASALTIASPYNHAVEGALVRNIWTGAGARLGLIALEVQNSNVKGLEQSVHSVFSTIYKADYNDGAFKNELGMRYAIQYGYHKAYACCQYAHSAIDALLEVRKRNVGKVNQVDRIVVNTHPKGMSLNRIHPDTSLGAKFSMPHIIAAGWVLGQVGRDAFTNEMLTNLNLEKLREKITMSLLENIKEPPFDRPAEVKVIFKDGTSDTEKMESATGDPDKPFDQELLTAKFKQMVSGVVNFPNQVVAFIFNDSSKDLKINRLIELLMDTEGLK